MVFFAGQVLDSAVEDAARLIKTGRAQAASYEMSDFRAVMCEYTFGLFGTGCPNVKISVKKIASFSDANASTTVQTCTTLACNWTLDEDFEPGAGRDVIQVFAYYRWPLTVVLPWFNLKNQPDNYRLLGATRVFRNEPFNAT